MHKLRNFAYGADYCRMSIDPAAEVRLGLLLTFVSFICSVVVYGTSADGIREMFLADLLRKFPQHKALHCYLLLSVWILLLIAGVYKSLEPKPRVSEPLVTGELFHNLAVDVKTKKIFKICNLPDGISLGDEGTFIL